MTLNEKITSTLGILSLFFVVWNFGREIKKSRPNFRIKILEQALFKSCVHTETPFGSEKRYVTVLSIHVGISNNSSNSNSVVSASCKCGNGLVALKKDDRYVTGYRILDLKQIIGIEKTHISCTSWQIPSPQWSDAAPTHLQAGGYENGWMSYEVLSASDTNQKVRFEIEVIDSFDRKYRKKIALKVSDNVSNEPKENTTTSS